MVKTDHPYSQTLVGLQPTNAQTEELRFAAAGTLMLMRHLAQEVGPRGGRVNAIAPSIIHNEKMDQFMLPEVRQRVAESLPLRRIGEPDDVASAALFLASDGASWITGSVIDVAGGKVMI